MPLTQCAFSDLVGRIYDCGQDPALWPDTLARLVKTLGALAGWIGLQDPARRTERIAVEVGLSPEQRARYTEHFVSLSPVALTTRFMPADGVVALSDIVDRAAFRGTAFYEQWCRPHRVEDLIAGILSRSPAGCGSLSVSFDRPAAAETRELMRLLLPHLRRSVETGRLLAERSGETACLSAAMDALSAGVILLDAAGRVLRTNAAADAILREGDALRRMPAGTLAAAEPWSQGAFEAALAACRSGGDGPRPAIPFPSRRKAGPRGGLVGQIIPLHEAIAVARSPVCGAEEDPQRKAVAALFVQDPERPCAVPSEALVRLYGLTPGELRVLHGLMRDLTLSEIAEACGIGIATVRTHLARLFDKTGTRRQAELLRAVMAAAPALRAPDPWAAGALQPRRRAGHDPAHPSV
ncbi:helix-turn-helix transcriptional regulator [Methylobacterium sp. ID0610]|uniref:helix-turn-helix transcriptional regulator n=1 Tax=Methylobacterium carpenticola TaxID=3344827 RepID=UPI00367C94D8